MKHIIPILLVGLSACASAPSADETPIADYESSVSRLHEATDAYVEGVMDSADVVAVSTLQETTGAMMRAEFEEMEHIVGEISGCEMDAAGDEHMSAAEDGMSMMRTLWDDMVAAHGDHTELTDCQDAAEALETEMDNTLEGMGAHGDAWSGMGMECGEHME